MFVASKGSRAAASRAGAVALVLAAQVFGACSLITQIAECDADADCAGGTCSDGLCLPTGGTCTPASCLAERGAGWLCGKGGACVEATTPLCARTFGPIDSPTALVVGAVLPLSGGGESFGEPIEQGVDLAVRELNEAGGLGGGRSLVVISCDDGGNLDQARTVTRHLAEVVGVPAIIGPTFSGIYLSIVQEITRNAGTLTISPSATSPLITGLDDAGLAWRTAASDRFQGIALAALIETAPSLRRIVALGKDDAYGRGLLDAIGPALSARLGPDAFRPRTYPDPAKTTSPDYAGAVAGALNDFGAPDAVVVLGTTESITVMQLVERQLAETSTRTRYFFADGGKVPDLLAAIEAAPALRARVVGTEADHASGDTFAKFSLRVQQVFNIASPGIYAANAYDAVYVLAASAVTLPQGTQVSGASLASGIARLVSGRAAEVGPMDWSMARSVLAAGGSIDLRGASGPLDFDLTTGEAPANVALWRVRPGPSALRFEKGGQYMVSGTSGTWTLDEGL